jgi:hypothetical protein
MATLSSLVVDATIAENNATAMPLTSAYMLSPTSIARQPLAPQTKSFVPATANENALLLILSQRSTAVAETGSSDARVTPSQDNGITAAATDEAFGDDGEITQIPWMETTAQRQPSRKQCCGVVIHDRACNSKAHLYSPPEVIISIRPTLHPCLPSKAAAICRRNQDLLRQAQRQTAQGHPWQLSQLGTWREVDQSVISQVPTAGQGVFGGLSGKGAVLIVAATGEMKLVAGAD